MNGEPLDANRRHQGWWFADLCGLLPRLLPVCILFLGQSFVRLILPDGAPCAAN